MKGGKNGGAVSLWHYEGFPRDYNGYHLSGDKDGCRFLLGLVERFKKAHFPARKKFVLDVPSKPNLSVPACPNRGLPAQHLEIRYSNKFAEDYWSLSDNGGGVLIKTGIQGLRDLHRGSNDMLQGVGDWSTGEGKESLWFWWQI